MSALVYSLAQKDILAWLEKQYPTCFQFNIAKISVIVLIFPFILPVMVTFIVGWFIWDCLKGTWSRCLKIKSGLKEDCEKCEEMCCVCLQRKKGYVNEEDIESEGDPSNQEN